MPIYEYQCKACAHQVEALQKMTDEPLTECPSCHQPTLAKLVSAAGFQLKGSGWYATDYRPKAQPSDKTEKDPQSTDTKASETGSTDTKVVSTEKKESTSGSSNADSSS